MIGSAIKSKTCLARGKATAVICVQFAQATQQKNDE